ncbi:MAG: hypothetical protein K9M54_13050 [Kiritimatiellales bacterium]|nr:hypothetical protein [Kiritimatiellales bacterium]
MDDLAPLIFFLIIVVVNLFKFFVEKGGKAKQAPGLQQPRQPSGLEKFLEKLAEQPVPQPRATPNYERFEQARIDDLDEDEYEDIPPLPEPVFSRIQQTKTPEFRPLERPATTVPVVHRPGHAILSGSHGLRMPGNTFISSSTAGQVDFRISGKQALKNALLSQIIFSPPRAYDLSFDNTMIK